MTKKTQKLDSSHTVRVRTATLDRLRVLVAKVTQKGWSAVGAEREDQILPGSVIDQGLVLLEMKLKGTGR